MKRQTLHVEIPIDLYRALKIHVATEGTTIRHVVECGIRGAVGNEQRKDLSSVAA